MRERNQMQVYIYICAAAAVLLAVLAGVIFTSKISDPMSVIAVGYNSDDDDTDI